MASKKDNKIMQKMEKWWNKSKSNRKDVDWNWFIYDLWVNGYHYAKWDRDTKTITTTVRDKGKPKVVVNKTFTTLRAVRNFALRNKPRGEVVPIEWEQEDIEEAQDINRYLDYIHEKLTLQHKLRASVWHALKYSVGYWQVIWDDQAEDGAGEIDIRVIDPFDLYWDPNARDEKEARYAILAVKRNIEELKNDDKYDTKEVEKIEDDRKLAASSLKSRLMKIDRQSYGQDGNKGTVIVKECWYKEWNKKEEKYEVKVGAMAGGRLIRKPEDTGLEDLPFFTLKSDVEPLKMYGTGWVKNLIPVNRLLNRLESQLAEYNDLMNRGKYVVDKGAGVRVINNENGQIIERKRGYNVEQMRISPISTGIYQQISNANRYIEDIGGAHDASLGRIPAGAKSGRALEALQVGDSNNMSELVENIELFLEDVFEYAIGLASEKYQFARNIHPLTESGAREFMKVIGEGASNQPEEATVLPKKTLVDVKIGSWLAETMQARREVLKELYQLQAIDRQTLLQGYEIGNIADILKRTKEQASQEQAQQISGATLQQGLEQGMEGEQQQQVPPGQQAIAAVRSIINGQVPSIEGPVPPEFISELDRLLQSPEIQQLEEGTLDAIQTFRDQLAQGGGGYIRRQ